MGFYEQISKFYDDIFPVDAEEVEYISKAAGQPPRRILDVACGSGGYAVELAKGGYRLTAVDLDGEMVAMAREKAKRAGVDITVLQCDMRELHKTLVDSSPADADGTPSAMDTRFHCIFCIGNSLVHLGNLQEISGALKEMYGLLEAGGTLIVQTINYDRIIKYNVDSLPTIKNPAATLEFVRKYAYMEDSGLINFNTTLTVGPEGEKEVFENSIELFPIKSGDLLRLLQETGFQKIEFSGDFDGSDYDEEAYMLVAKAVK